ncbi:Retrotransposable element Tf2 [Gossypium australe]|uniref:Retrotransposable element Tf2 n=1 Tax=Gossypium australe TaxID=47621 RepID=A0A5B6WHS0_9ROSI|nr:Retrotransposable element Tf2 [Gossypium australe]
MVMVMDPERAVADNVESNAPTPTQGTTPSDSRLATSGQEEEAEQAFFQMMSEWFTQFVRNNLTPPVDKIRKYGAEEFRATSDDDAEKAEFRFIDQKWKEFLELKQCRISVTEYEREFVRLSQYARECVSIEAIMCKRFEDDLNKDIRLLVGILEIKEFIVLVDRACKAKALGKDKRKAESEVRDNPRSDNAPARGRPSRSVRNVIGSQRTTKDTIAKSEARVPARAYAIRAREEASSPDVITVSSKTLPIESTEFVIKVSNPLGKSVLVDKVCKNYPLMFRDICFPADLMLLPFDEFDMILGMNWLTLHDAIVNCKRNTIDLRCQNNEIVRVESNDLIGLPAVMYVLKAQRYVKKGYEVYFAYMINSKVNKKKVESVPVVCEFPDVFPEELLGLPLIREVEFGIDLLPGMTPILIAPYRMAPVELKKLKSQLQELTDRGFARLSFSPWGALVLIDDLFDQLKGATVFFKDRYEIGILPVESERFRHSENCFQNEPPKNVSEVRSFLGLAGYYRRFVKGFSMIATPLAKLLQKDVRFEWSDKCQKSFDQLKALLTEALVLVRPGSSKDLKYLMTQKDMNLRQRSWLELLKDYELVIDYHPGKANKVDDEMFAKRARCDLKSNSEFRVHADDCLSRLSVHPGSTKMYHDLKQHYWWSGMKRDISEFVSKCLVYQQVKVEHQVPSGLLQPILIPEWKWATMTMKFVSGLPLTPRKKDAIWVAVDQLTNSSHFIPVRSNYSLDKLAELYIFDIVRLHEVPLSIVLDRDLRFTSQFWRKLQEALGMKLHFSNAFHPQTDGQTEWIIQILEDMLRCCILEFDDLKRKDIEFEIGDKVFLKVSAWKKALRF